jgi:hypothetical protein
VLLLTLAPSKLENQKAKAKRLTLPSKTPTKAQANKLEEQEKYKANEFQKESLVSYLQIKKEIKHTYR